MEQTWSRAARIVGFAFAWRPHQAVYVATGGPPGEVFCPLDEVIGALRPILESESPGKVGQNLKYDMAVLKNYGVALNGLRCDSMVASYLLHPASRSHGLDALARRHLNYSTVKITEVIGKGRKQVAMDAVPIEKVAPYACEDADVALQLSDLLTAQLKEQGLLVAIGKLRTLHTVQPDLVGKLPLHDRLESELPEEGRQIRENEDAGDPILASLLDALLHQLRADPLPAPRFFHRERAHFRQVRPHDP